MAGISREFSVVFPPLEGPTRKPRHAGAFCQKNPRVRKIRVCNSGAGNGCANFMGAWKKGVLSAGKPMYIKFLVLGGGGYLGLGGGECRFYSYGCGGFLIFSTHSDTQAVPAFHNVQTFKGIFSTGAFF